MTAENELNTLVKSRIDSSSPLASILTSGYLVAHRCAPDNYRGHFFVYEFKDTEKDGLITKSFLEIYGNFQLSDSLVAQQAMQEVIKLFNNKTFNGTYTSGCRFWLAEDQRQHLIKKDEVLQTNLVEKLIVFECRWVDSVITEDEIYP